MKIKELQNELKKRKIGFALFYNLDFGAPDGNMLYFSQYLGVGVLVIPAKKRPFLIAPKMEYKRAKKGLIKNIHMLKKGKRLFEFAKEIIKKDGINAKVIAIDKDSFSLRAYRELKRNFKGAKTADISRACSQLRAAKTEKEVMIIKNGCRISDAIFKKCITNFKIFLTEADVKAFMEYEAKKLGCELAFPTIVASGRNSAMAHHDTEPEKLKRGFCVIDFGVRYKNYCTDTSRTIYIGKPGKEEIMLYDFLLKIQKEAIKMVKEGMKCSSLNQFVLSSLKNYKKYFTHGLGHGIGINIHEKPDLTEKSKDRIMDSMVFTIEPAIYLKNKGMRIEDSILFKNKKAIILTKATKELITISR